MMSNIYAFLLGCFIFFTPSAVCGYILSRKLFCFIESMLFVCGIWAFWFWLLSLVMPYLDKFAAG